MRMSSDNEQQERPVNPEDINAVARRLREAMGQADMLNISEAEYHQGLAVAAIDELIKRGNHHPRTSGVTLREFYAQLTPSWQKVLQACCEDQFGTVEGILTEGK